MSLVLVTPPSSLPIDLSLAKQQCRVDIDADDVLIQAYINAAVEHVEAYTGRQLVTATWDLVLDGFGCVIDVPKAPLQSVTSVTYIDYGGTEQVLASSGYKVIGASTTPQSRASRGRIEVAYGTYWPPTRYEGGSVTVRFVAGYGNASAVPAGLIQAMLLLISHWYRNREPVVTGTTVITLPMAVDALLSPYRTWPLRPAGWTA
jgi:uncharacterized phiE125 gp8 family phage protein